MRKLIITLTIVLLLVGIFACLIGFVGIYAYNTYANNVTEHNFPLKQKWMYQAEEVVDAMGVNTEEQIIVARTVNTIFALDASKGQLIWKLKPPKTFDGSAPVINNGIVIVTHSQGTVAYDLKTGKQLWQATDNPKSRGHQSFVAAVDDDIVVIIGGFIAIRDLHTGSLLWSIERANPDEEEAMAAINNNQLYVIFFNQVRNYDLFSGELNWTTETPHWSLLSMLFKDDVLFLENSLNDGVGAFSVKARRLIWQQKGNIETYSNPITSYGNYLFVPIRNGVPVAVDTKTGNILWEATTLPNDTYLTSLALNDVLYVKSLFGRNLYALKLENGELIGRLDLGLPSLLPAGRFTSVGPFSLSDTSIAFADKNRVFVYGR